MYSRTIPSIYPYIGSLTMLLWTFAIPIFYHGDYPE